MSVAREADQALGAPVVRTSYADGEPGIQHSLKEIARRVREGASTFVMKSFVGNVLKQAGFPHGARARYAAILDYVRKNVAYAADCPGTEQIQTAAISLCVEGAPVCIPIGDCFVEGTLLLRKDGQLVPVEQLKVGELIWGYDKWTRVEAVAFKGRLKVDAIEMNNGSTMFLTPGHYVYVGRCKHGKGVEEEGCTSGHGACVAPGARAESFERVRVSELVEGDVLLQPERIAFGQGSPDPDRAYVEGLALADGWVQSNTGFAIAGRDGMRKEKQKHEVKAICDRLGIKTRWHRRYISVRDKAWAQRLMQLGKRARFKHLETLDLGEAAAAATLRGLMADSTANTFGNGRTYSTTSPFLVTQVRVLHRMFGVSTGIRMLTPEQHGGAGKHPLWRMYVRGGGPHHQAEKKLAIRSLERAVCKVPCWDIQTQDHYVYLPEHDVTTSNCDDLVTALATLVMAAGNEVEIVRQFFGDGIQQHVLVEARDEQGQWVPLDPSSKTMPAGQKAHAAKETRLSPLDDQAIGLVGAPDAEFVGIGALPVLEWKEERWTMMDATTGLGHGGASGACCASCAAGGTCEGKSGLGILGVLAHPADNWRLHAGVVPSEVLNAERGVSIFHGADYWHVHPTGEVYVNRGVRQSGFARAPGGGGGHPGGHPGGGGGGHHPGGGGGGGHPRPQHRAGFRHGRRFHGGRWWDWDGGQWLIVESVGTACSSWGDPIVPSDALRAEAVAQLVASDGNPVTETWTDGRMYLFEAHGDHGTIDGVRASVVVRPCVSVSAPDIMRYGLSGAGLGADSPPAGSIPYQPVPPQGGVTTIKAGLRYKVSMVLGFEYDPSESAVTPGGLFPKLLHPAAADEARARFVKDWSVENLAPAAPPTRISMLPYAVTSLTGQVAYTQPWILQGIALHDMTLPIGAADTSDARPSIGYQGAYVQASSPVPNTPPSPTPIPPPKGETTPGESSFATGILVAVGFAAVGGTVWYGAKQGWFGNPLQKIGPIGHPRLGKVAA